MPGLFFDSWNWKDPSVFIKREATRSVILKGLGFSQQAYRWKNIHLYIACPVAKWMGKPCLRSSKKWNIGVWYYVCIATIEIFPNVIISLFMKPTQEVLAIAPGILRVYGLSYAIISYNIFLTYYFQAVLKSGASMVISLARGVIVSSAMIILLPMLFPSEALWLAMPVTEAAVAVYGTYAMIKMNRSIRAI